MKKIFPILLFTLFAFTNNTTNTIVDFAKKENDNYSIVKTFKPSNYTSLIDNHNLHFDKKEILIKAKNTKANTSSLGMGIYAKINLWQYSFQTKEKRMQVQDSLLKCFPPKCTNIKKTETALESHPAIYIFCDTIIYIAKTSCEQKNKEWDDLQFKMVDEFAKENDSILTADCEKIRIVRKETFAK